MGLGKISLKPLVHTCKNSEKSDTKKPHEKPGRDGLVFCRGGGTSPLVGIRFSFFRKVNRISQ
jgi:hypothetical protein